MDRWVAAEAIEFEVNRRHGARPELEELRPYLDLARQIRAEVDHIAADDDADAYSLVEALEAVPARERADVARRVLAPRVTGPE